MGSYSKPSKFQWFPILGLVKLGIDYYKGKPTVIDEIFEKTVKGNVVGLAYTLYQSAAILGLEKLLEN